MASNSTAARTNLTSQSVIIHKNQIVGDGAFRIAYAGTYRGGNRNQQEAVCKSFRRQYSQLEKEFFAADYKIAYKAIEFAEKWNEFCAADEKILITIGDVMQIGGTKYLVEPLIRYFTKFTSNNGWISDDGDWTVRAMEAFSHFTYHHSGGSLLVCDIQGRHRHNRFANKKSRFELTDPAICSRRRLYGPTDLGEKGIESFFNNHECNDFCHSNGERWQRPRGTCQWFVPSHQTSMLNSTFTGMLNTRNTVRFGARLQPICDDYNDSSDDSW